MKNQIAAWVAAIASCSAMLAELSEYPAPRSRRLNSEVPTVGNELRRIQSTSVSTRRARGLVSAEKLSVRYAVGEVGAAAAKSSEYAVTSGLSRIRSVRAVLPSMKVTFSTVDE